MKNKPYVYLDNQATAPIDPRVLSAMVPFLTTDFGNCHSQHLEGRKASIAVEQARANVASIINADPGEIVFTSGATEANNMAIKGVYRYQGDKKPHLVTSKIEHKCVLESTRAAEAEGMTAHYLDVDDQGFVDLDQLADICKLYKDKISIVSVLAANNEIGTVQNLNKIGEITHSANALFHTDAAQYFGKGNIDVRRDNIDLLSISGHKIYGPKGVGALFVNKKKRVRLVPLLSGGGQENNLRSGTLPVFLCVGLGEAARVAGEDMLKDKKHYESLWNYAKDRLGKLEGTRINGPMDLSKRIPNNFNISFYGVEGESLMLALDDQVAVSSGSACTSQSLEPSHVLHALGLEPEAAHTAIRLGWNRWTSKKDLESAFSKIEEEVLRLRGLSVMWDYFKQGKKFEVTTGH